MPSTPYSDSLLRVDRLFRWRGRDVSRIEAFSDAAFAFALTYLALTSVAPATFDELGRVMTTFIPFAMTFALLGMIWIDHYLYFRRYDIRDGFTITLNFVLLFLVLFYVYPDEVCVHVLERAVVRPGRRGVGGGHAPDRSGAVRSDAVLQRRFLRDLRRVRAALRSRVAAA